MRTTLTLDDDVAAKLTSKARKAGQSFKAVVNETLRRGLAAAPATPERVPFKVKARDLGLLHPGLTLDDVAGLLEQIEGPMHR